MDLYYRSIKDLKVYEDIDVVFEEILNLKN
jgi:hypothetical protein